MPSYTFALTIKNTTEENQNVWILFKSRDW
jgi:hypothetical protein